MNEYDTAPAEAPEGPLAESSSACEILSPEELADGDMSQDSFDQYTQKFLARHGIQMDAEADAQPDGPGLQLDGRAEGPAAEDPSHGQEPATATVSPDVEVDSNPIREATDDPSDGTQTPLVRPAVAADANCDLSGMRELANTSAHMAIETSSCLQLVARAHSTLTYAVAAIGATFLLLRMEPVGGRLAVAAGFGVMCLAMLWSYRYHSATCEAAKAITMIRSEQDSMS